MATIVETINTAYGVYIKSCNRGELARAAESLAAMLEDKLVSKGISAENRENAQFLKIKLQLKALASEYFCAGYEREDFSALESFAAQAIEKCGELGFKKTGELVKRVFESAKAIDGVMFDAVALKGRICDGEGRCVAANADECRSVSAELKRKISLVGGLELPENIFSDGAQFPDIKSQTIDDLNGLCAVADKMAAAFCAEQVKDYMRTAAEDITVTLKGKRYEYYPDADVSNLARAIVLFTPYPNEAELFAIVNADGASVYRLQSLAFENVEEGVISEVFNNFTNLGADVVIYGMPHFRAKNGGAFYRAVMQFCRGGRRAYIVADDGTRTVYDEALKAATGELTALDISFLYLTMPDFVQTVELMQKLGMLTGDGDGIDFVRRNMPFVGFAGFNAAVKAFHAGADWKKIAAECSHDNFRAASKYMLRLSRQALFIDGGWGNYHDDIVVNKSKRFDYDDIKGVNPDNIRKIMDGNFTLFQKCGMISTYCLLSGASASDWSGFSPELKSERLSEASKLVMRALGVDIVPKVEVLDNLPKGAGGTCYDGGKRIVYKNSCVKDFDWTSKAVCHECFHAFQHTAIAEGWQDWYETELHVTPGRIDQWSYNFGKYRNIDKDYEGYMIQIVESDARAFENDCLGRNESMGQILNLIDLD